MEYQFVYTKQILRNVDETIKAELGNEYFSLIPIIVSDKEKMRIVFPVFKKSVDSVSYNYLYEIDIVSGEIIERNSLYDVKTFLMSDIVGFNIADVRYEKAYDILDKFRINCINEGFNKNLYEQYYEEFAIKLSPKFRNIIKEIIEDKEIIENFFPEFIDFEWEVEDGLKNVPDDVLKFALWVNDNSLIIISEKDEKRVNFKSKIIKLCDFNRVEKYSNYNMDILINSIENNDGILPDGKKIIGDTFRLDDYYKYIHSICETCNYSRCPERMAIYIKYLIEKGILEEKLKEREEYRSKNEVNSFFAFTWEPEGGLKYISQNMFEVAYELVKRNAVTVMRNLNGKNEVRIDTAYGCDEYIKISDVNSIEKLNRKLPKDWLGIGRTTTQTFNFCNSYSCRLESCLIFVAGYIYYLIMSGQEHIIEEDRKYYKEHEAEILIQINEKKNNKISKIKEKNEEKTKLFSSKYQENITNLNSLLEILNDDKRNNMYCIIEGERGLGQVELVKNIASILKETGRIEETEIKNGDKVQIESATIEMPFQNLYSGVTTSYNTIVKYRFLRKKKLHVITGIEEFMSDYRRFKESPGYAPHDELRKKQIDHIIKLLSRIEDDTYIVILGEKKHIDNFLNLNQKIKNIYRECYLTIKNLSVEEIFEEYKKNLKVDLIELLRNNERIFKDEFFEFISINKKGLPFNNVELAEYLALYSNSKNSLSLPDNIYKKETVEESLANIIGLENIKRKLKEYETYMLFRSRAENMGLNLSSANMHMIFTGNPGVGKTTIARIMAKMLFDMGVLHENKLIEVERKDLVGQFIGHTAPKTEEVIEKAMGGVLFIDEAYSLVPKDNSRDFGQEAIATLIKAMEDRRGEFVVIFAGYKDEMKGFVDSNPGIASRIGYTFDFPDYTANELIEIYKLKMKNSGFIVNEDIDEELKFICAYFVKRKAFGNGRFVDKLIQETLLKHSKQADMNNLNLINRTDLPSIEVLTNSEHFEKSTVEEALNKVIGLEQLKNKMKEFECYIRFNKKAQESGLDMPNQNMHMIYTGNPGCGKTTIARIMAKMLFDMGVLHENKLIEVDRKDLVGEHIGQTAIKTSEIIEKAMGGVLFIDEAYSLVPEDSGKDFGHEAIATLIKAMEDRKGEFVVIFAGYKDEMKGFVDSNPGIASRIGYTFDFPDYTANELIEIYKLKMKNSGFILLDSIEDKLKILMKYFSNVDNIGNGRFVDKVIQETLIKHSKNNESIINISENDIPTVQEMTEVIFNNSRMINPEDISEESKRKTAIHEIGHATIGLLLFDKPGIKKITINVEGTGTLGYVQYENQKSFTSSKSELLNRIKRLLGGMVCEEIFFGEFDNGNTSDLAKATNIAKNMITKYGMSSLGLGQIDEMNGDMTKVVHDEINNILGECYKETTKLLKENKTQIDKVVEYLMINKEITEEEFIAQFSYYEKL